MKPDQYKYGMPEKREGILAMSRVYVKKAVEKGASLGMSPAEVAAGEADLDNAKASHLIVMDTQHARPVDYRHNDECFEALEYRMTDWQERYFRIPPCTQEDLDDLKIVKKINRNKPYARPKETADLMGENTGAGDMHFHATIRKGGPKDEKGQIKGTIWKYGIRGQGDSQLKVGQMTHTEFSGGMSLDVHCPLSDIGKIIDISVALKNGSGQPGHWSPVRSFVLS